MNLFGVDIILNFLFKLIYVTILGLHIYNYNKLMNMHEW